MALSADGGPAKVLFLILLALVGIVVLWLSLAIQVTRWHDLSKPGGMVLINLIPVIGTLVAFVMLGFVKGSAGSNIYGGEAKELRSRRLLNSLAPFIGLIFVVDFFCLFPSLRPYFLTGANYKIILNQTAITAVGALGMTMIIISGGIDLSVGSLIALTSVVAALLLLDKCPPLVAAMCAVLVGGFVGALNGAMIAGFRMMPFIVTLGMMGIARGAAKWLAKSQVLNAPSSFIDSLMASNNPDQFFPLPPGVWITLGLAGVMAVVMRRTVFGRYIFAIGSNESAARLCGIRVQWQKVIIYSLAGLFFGLAGVFQMSRLSEGDPTVAIGLELDIIAAVVIGGASLNGGSGSILGSIIGALIMAVLRNGSNQMGLPTYMQEILIGVIIILAVGLDKLRQRRAT